MASGIAEVGCFQESSDADWQRAFEGVKPPCSFQHDKEQCELSESKARHLQA